MGEMLKETERAKPGPDKKDRSSASTESPTLSEIGVSKNESARAQRAVISGKIANMEHGEMGLKVANSSENNQSPNSDTPTTRL